MLSTIIVLLVDIYPDEERGDFTFIDARELWLQMGHYQEPLHIYKLKAVTIFWIIFLLQTKYHAILVLFYTISLLSFLLAALLMPL